MAAPHPRPVDPQPRRPRRQRAAPARDHGLFGPDSMTWRLHRRPGALLVGGLRALIIQSLHPLAVAGVDQHSDYRNGLLPRLRRTAAYVAAVSMGSTAQAQRAAAGVRAIHTHINGMDPVTGRPYSAEDPSTLLWVHCVEVHSFLTAYRTYGGSLPPAEQDRYLAEQVRAAELIGIPGAQVPGSRAEYRDYFGAMEPRLCLSRASREAIGVVIDPPLTRELAPYWVALRAASTAAVAIVPRRLRRLIGIDHPSVIDAAVRPALRPLIAASTLPGAEVLLRGAVGHETVRIIGDALRPDRVAA